jgi:NAD-reducing hydrogenase small subunit
MGGIPALRNGIPLQECYDEAYRDGPSRAQPQQSDSQRPRIAAAAQQGVSGCHEVVKIDYHLPGCPPSADTLWAALTALLTDQPVELAVRIDQIRLTRREGPMVASKESPTMEPAAWSSNR